MAVLSSLLTFPSTWYQLSWHYTAIYLALSTIHTVTVSSSKTNIPYSKHCASFVSEPVPNTVPQFATTPFPPNQDGYFLGREEILLHPNSSSYYYPSSNRGIIFFHTQHVYSTDVNDVYKVEATLILKTTSTYFENVSFSYSVSPQVFTRTSKKGPLSFEVEGFWSKSTGKLCMVGSGSAYSEEGNLPVFAVRLKLDDVKSSSSITSLIRGTLESLSPEDETGYFKPISLLMFPRTNYKYNEVSTESGSACKGGIDVPKDSSLSLTHSVPFCSLFSLSSVSFKLQYSSACKSAKSCNPFGEGIGYLPQVMSLRLIHCSEDIKSLKFLVEFPKGTYVDYYSPFNPNTTLVAEGSWDAGKNRLCVVACRILEAGGSFTGARVDDCSIRLSVRFPSVWSISSSSGMVGQIWSNKTANNPLVYFDRITFRSYEDHHAVGVPGLKYNYTMVDTARKSCPQKKPGKDNSKQLYPDANSDDMTFTARVKNLKRRRAEWGYCEPIVVGDQIAPRAYYVGLSNSLTERKTNHRIPLNMSYKMSFNLLNASKEVAQAEIYAEGIYDAETGSLCMVGCRYVDSENQKSVNDSTDCEIVVNIQFPPIDSNDRIHGSIESTRETSSPLYFEPHSFSAVAYYISNSRDTIWRMDSEIIMALISNTLVSVLVLYQIWYVKRFRSVFPFISLLMLLVLSLGHMIPLILNFEALFLPKKNRVSFLLRSGGWLEANEVIVRVVTMVALLLQFRLMQIVWSSRVADGKGKESWVAERRTLYVSLPLYISGGLIALFVNRRNNELGDGMQYTYGGSNQRSLWVDLRSYAGLVLDGFLFPQIVLNIFQNSRENALSRLFYLGFTFVRLLPHAYDLYRAHYDVEDFDWSYMYANLGEDYFSTAWDIIIPFVGLVFAAIIYLQQRFGGRCFMPKRFKELEVYEKVPVIIDA